MFGLSVGKILVVVAAFGAVAVGAKIMRQMNRSGGGGSVDKDASPEGVDAANLLQCPKCDAYTAKNCGKPACPIT